MVKILATAPSKPWKKRDLKPCRAGAATRQRQVLGLEIRALSEPSRQLGRAKFSAGIRATVWAGATARQDRFSRPHRNDARLVSRSATRTVAGAIFGPPRPPPPPPPLMETCVPLFKQMLSDSTMLQNIGKMLQFSPRKIAP